MKENAWYGTPYEKMTFSGGRYGEVNMGLVKASYSGRYLYLAYGAYNNRIAAAFM